MAISLKIPKKVGGFLLVSANVEMTNDIGAFPTITLTQKYITDPTTLNWIDPQINYVGEYYKDKDVSIEVKKKAKEVVTKNPKIKNKNSMDYLNLSD